MQNFHNIRQMLVEQGWHLLILRFVIGYGFVAHGWAKLEKGPENFAFILANAHIPMPYVMAWVTTVLEFVGGIGIILGIFSSFFSIPLILIMLTAMLTVHLRYGFSSVRLKSITVTGAQFGEIGFEINLIYIAGLIIILLGGPGRISIDQRWLSKKLH